MRVWCQCCWLTAQFWGRVGVHTNTPTFTNLSTRASKSPELPKSANPSAQGLAGTGSRRHLPQRPQCNRCFFPLWFLFWLEIKTRGVKKLKQSPSLRPGGWLGKGWFAGNWAEPLWKLSWAKMPRSAQRWRQQGIWSLLSPESLSQERSQPSTAAFKAVRRKLFCLCWALGAALIWGLPSLLT